MHNSSDTLHKIINVYAYNYAVDIDGTDGDMCSPDN